VKSGKQRKMHKVTRVQGYRATEIHEYRASRLHGYRVIWIQRCRIARMKG
jgi:hypothetical protein